MDEWMRCMRRGDFAGAWRVSDRVTRARAGSRADHLPRHQQWIWDGSPIAGRRVLVPSDPLLRRFVAPIDAGPVQRGVRSRLYDRGRYSPTRETGVHHFHRLLAEFLSA